MLGLGVLVQAWLLRGGGHRALGGWTHTRAPSHYDMAGSCPSTSALLSALGLSIQRVAASNGGKGARSALTNRQLLRLERLNGKGRPEGKQGDSDAVLPKTMAGQQADLLLVRRWRQRQKRALAQSMLRGALTWEQHVHLSFGETSFFELRFANPLQARLRLRSAWPMPTSRTAAHRQAGATRCHALPRAATH